MHGRPAANGLEFLAGGGRMADLIRDRDWTQSPLGPLETWPQSLRTAIGIMLNSKFPTYMAWGPELTSLYNDAYRPVLGLKPEALGRPFAQVWSDVWDDVGPIAARALAGEASYFEDLPLTMERKGHPEQTWWTFSYSPIRDDGGAVAGVLCTVHETTGRVLAEAALKDSEALKGAILEAALDCIVSITDDSRVIEWNPAAERTFGYARAEAMGRDLAEIIIPLRYRERHYRGMARYLATGEGPVIGRRVELEALRADGSEFPVELAISPISIGGRPHFTAYLRDITIQKRAEAELRDSEQRLRATYEHAFAGIAEVDANGRFLRVNEQLCAMTGFSREELLTRSFADITHADYREEDLEQFRRQMAGEIDAYVMEKRYIEKTGRPVWVEVSASTVNDLAGRRLYGIRVARDISESKRAEEHRQLLVNELNHRVKNTLATVQSLASQSLRNAASTEQARRAFESRLVALSRAHDVLTRENWEGAGLAELISRAVEPYRSAGESRIHLAGPDLWIAPRMALALAMALQELATNAVKYGALTSESGRIDIVWAIDQSVPPCLSLRWIERGGPPVCPPRRRGFGSQLIERSLAHDLGGEARLDFDRAGLVCSIQAPLAEPGIPAPLSAG